MSGTSGSEQREDSRPPFTGSKEPCGREGCDQPIVADLPYCSTLCSALANKLARRREKLRSVQASERDPEIIRLFTERVEALETAAEWIDADRRAGDELNEIFRQRFKEQSRRGER